MPVILLSFTVWGIKCRLILCDSDSQFLVASEICPLKMMQSLNSGCTQSVEGGIFCHCHSTPWWAASFIICHRWMVSRMEKRKDQLFSPDSVPLFSHQNDQVWARWIWFERAGPKHTQMKGTGTLTAGWWLLLVSRLGQVLGFSKLCDLTPINTMNLSRVTNT